MSSRNFKYLVLWLIFVLSVRNSHAQYQAGRELETKAIHYFCNNIAIIKEKVTTKPIRFSGYTLAKASNVYEIADCFGDIKLIKDSIPNKLELDSLKKVNDLVPQHKIKIKAKCSIFTKNIFSNFDRDIFTLYVFNGIEYHGYYYVQLFLFNKNQGNWTFAIRFDRKTNEAIDYCLTGTIY
jgi:hypothetical protein